MKILLSEGFNYLDNCSDLTDEEKEIVKDLTVSISTEDAEDIEYVFLDEHCEIVVVLEVDNDEVYLVESNLDQYDID